MSLTSSIQLAEMEDHYLLRETVVIDGEKHYNDWTYPKTDEGFDAASEHWWQIARRPAKDGERSPFAETPQVYVAPAVPPEEAT